MAPIRHSPQRQHRSRSNAFSDSRDSSFVSAFPGSGLSPSERGVMSHPIARIPRRVSRHRSQAWSHRQPSQSLQRHISNGSYFQGTSHISRVTRELLAASDELQHMLNRGQAQRGHSSREPTRRVVSAGNMQQTSQISRLDGNLDQVPHVPHQPTTFQNNLYTWETTYPAPNEASYGQRQHQQTPEPPRSSPRLPCLNLSPVSPCERGPAMSEEQRHRLLHSMPGYQSSSSPTAEHTLLQGRLAPEEERPSSTDAGMHDIIEDLEFENLKAWPANGNTLASSGDGGGDWVFLDNVADNSSSPSDNWSMNNASSDYQDENPLLNRFQAVSDRDGQRPGYFLRDLGPKEEDQDVELLTERLQNQELAGEGNPPGCAFSEM